MHVHEFGGFLIMMGLLAASMLIVISFLWLRYRRLELLHRERMAALEKGAELPALGDTLAHRPWSPRVYLLRGMMWLFAGIALFVFLFAMGVTNRHPDSVESKVMRMSRLRHMGIPEEELKAVMDDRTPRENGPGPAAGLLGLIPAGIGLAYLIYYRSERKTAPQD